MLVVNDQEFTAENRTDEQRQNCFQMAKFLERTLQDRNFNLNNIIIADERIQRYAGTLEAWDADLATEASLIGLAEGKPMLVDCGTTGCVFGFAPAVFEEYVWDGRNVVLRDERLDHKDQLELMNHFANVTLGCHYNWLYPSNYEIWYKPTRELLAKVLYEFSKDPEMGNYLDPTLGLASQRFSRVIAVLGVPTELDND